jgi:hypothetical protein
VSAADDHNRDAVDSFFAIGSCPLAVRLLTHSGWIAVELFTYFGEMFSNHRREGVERGAEGDTEAWEASVCAESSANIE